MNVILVGFTKKGARKEITIQSPTVVIGRTTEADIQIPVSDVSRRHCQISVGPNKVVLKDLGSSNGTFVNQQKVAETTLRPGDRLTVGPFTFVVQIDGQPKDIKPSAPKAGPAVAASPETKTKPGSASAEKEFDIDDLNVDLSDIDLDDMSPIESLDELEEINPNDLEELDESDILEEDEKPKGK